MPAQKSMLCKGFMMKALNRKLWRDLWRMKGQVFAVTLVVMSGVATFIWSLTAQKLFLCNFK